MAPSRSHDGDTAERRVGDTNQGLPPPLAPNRCRRIVQVFSRSVYRTGRSPSPESRARCIPTHRFHAKQIAIPGAGPTEMCLAHLLATTRAPRDARSLLWQEHRAPAQFRLRAHALGQAVARGRCRTYRPANRCEGLNLAASDVLFLSQALNEYYASGSTQALGGHSARTLARVWKAERLSWWFTGLTHRHPNMDSIDRRMQAAELAYIRTFEAAQAMLAENCQPTPRGGLGARQ